MEPVTSPPSEISPTPKRSSRVVKGAVLAVLLVGAVAVAVLTLRRAQESFFEEVLVEASFEPTVSVTGEIIPKKSLVGSLAPDFTLENEAGTQVTLRDFRGKPIVLLFFARWNDSSLEALRTLQNAEARLTKNGVLVLPIGSLEEKGALQGLKERGAFTVTFLADLEGGTGELYGVRTLPTFFFMNAHGIITKEYLGHMQADDMLLYALEK